MQRLTLIAVAFVLESLTLWPSAAFAEQPKPTATPGISSPRAEPPLDPFAVAVYSESTSPYFVLVTIVDDRTGVSWQVCTKAEALVGAMMTEWQLSYENNARRRAAQRIIANATRTYHLSNPKALANVAPRYTEAQLATVRERLQGYSREQLIKLFRAGSSYHAYIKRGEDFDALQYAAAFVLEEHGLTVRMGDITGQVYVLTTEDLVRQEHEYAMLVAAWQEERRRAMGVAKGLAGYSAIFKVFTITDATTADVNGGLNTLSCDLSRRTRSLVDEATWYNPIVASAPQYPWTVFLQRYARATQVASRLRWLRVWKQWTGGTVSYECFGATGIASEFDLPDVLKAWCRAGLPGGPEYELTLFHSQKLIAIIYLKAHSQRALVCNYGDIDFTDPKYNVSGVRPIPLPGGLVPQRPADQRRLGVTFHTIAGLTDYYVAVPVRRRP